MSKVAISFLAALERELDIDGTAVVVRTADMDQILALIGHTEPLQGELAQAPASVQDAINGYELDATEKAAVLAWGLGLVARHREAVRAIVGICVKQPPAFIGQLLPDRFMALLLLSLEVNADFFSQMLRPLLDLSRGMPGVAQAVAQLRPAPAPAASTGQPPSSS